MPLLGQVLEQYPTQVKLVFKNFPLRNHAHARAAALAALAAGEQNKFWEFHDLLFKNFSSLDASKFGEFAEQLGLDRAKFDADRASPALVAKIDRDLREASRVGVRGTPTIYVDGRQLTQRNLAGFRAAIEAALNRQRGR